VHCMITMHVHSRQTDGQTDRGKHDGNSVTICSNECIMR